MAAGRPTIRLSLSEEQRVELIRMVEARKTPQAEAKRARAVLLSAEGCDDKEVGRQVGFSNATAGKWRKRYAAEGMAGLTDAPRSGPPRTIDDEKVADILRLTLETKPTKGTQATRGHHRSDQASDSKQREIGPTALRRPFVMKQEAAPASPKARGRRGIDGQSDDRDAFHGGAGVCRPWRATKVGGAASHSIPDLNPDGRHRLQMWQ